MMFTAVVVVTNVKVLLFSSQHTVASLFFIFGSILLYVATVAACANIQYQNNTLYKIFNTYTTSFLILMILTDFFVRLFGTANSWWGWILIIGVTTMVDFALTRYIYMSEKMPPISDRTQRVPLSGIEVGSSSPYQVHERDNSIRSGIRRRKITSPAFRHTKMFFRFWFCVRRG